MRNAFAAELTALAARNGRIVMLSGDIGNRLFNDYKDRYPDRFYNCGVAEANMIGVAAGLCTCGLKPIVYTITPFITTRVLEQIKVDICYYGLPVIIVGVGAGLSYAELGPTHHSCDDIAQLRTLPGMSVVCPGDALEVRAALKAAASYDSPVYIRIGKKNEPVIHEAEPEITIGRAITVRDGRDVCLLSTGTLLPEAMSAAGRLDESGVSAKVVSFHTVKPLDENMLREAFGGFRAVATLEEHSVLGGFGGSVAEWLAENRLAGAPLLRFGAPDAFYSVAGKQKDARKEFGLDAASIAERLLAELKK